MRDVMERWHEENWEEEMHRMTLEEIEAFEASQIPDDTQQAADLDGES